MLSDETNNALILLETERGGLWFGKHFMQELLSDKKPDYVQVTINYLDDKSFGIAVGLMIGNGYKSEVPARTDGSYGYQIGDQVIVLRREKVTVVVNFDNLHYGPKTKKLFYQGEPLSDRLRKALQEKKCTILFNPREKQDETEFWVERRKAFLSYIEQKWTLLDFQGNVVNFVDAKEPCAKLDPMREWKVFDSSAPPKLTIADFRKDFDELMVKYAELFGTSK